MDRFLRRLKSLSSSSAADATTPSCSRSPERNSGSEISPFCSVRSSESHDEMTDSSRLRCSICQEDLHSTNSDSSETPCILPCSHIFGSICIQKWLSASPHQNCPACRHSMLYTSCQHPIEPLPLSDHASTPQPECFPSKCQLCREGGKWSHEVELLEERLWFEQGILERLGTFLAWDVGPMSTGYMVNVGVDDRVVESRRRFESGWRDIRLRYEAEVGRAW
jgi:hypothetical protein